MRACESQALVTRLASSLRPESREMAVMTGAKSSQVEGAVTEERPVTSGSRGLGRLNMGHGTAV